MHRREHGTDGFLTGAGNLGRRFWRTLELVKRSLAVAMGLALASAAFAQSADEIQKNLTLQARTIQSWGREALFVSAVNAQNAKRVPAARIKETDERWMAGKAAALVREVTTGPCADRLRQLVTTNSSYGESFVMDNQGAIVCATARTSDYWQGDEMKWQRAFNGGKGAVFIDRPKLDESAAKRLAQISVPVIDNGRIIGALTVGVTIGK